MIRMHSVVYCDGCGARFPEDFSEGTWRRVIRRATRRAGWKYGRDKEGGGFMDLCPECS